MIGLLQRVTAAAVEVEGREIARIGAGLLVLVAVERGDDETTAERQLERLLNYRVFADADGRMNRSLLEAGGALLLVPQFTLAADTAGGLRPGFSQAAPPAEAERLFAYLAVRAGIRLPGAQSGRFGAHMRVSLTNDGPVTFWIRVPGPGDAEGNGVS
ncbi:MAG TPA: D-aminoacyl-tRNA deacylase [Steroidobacteraceae bacterium]|nr:D-aminoacyl-tRNA deacylase [Steroidobacteraceae bacterium]